MGFGVRGFGKFWGLGFWVLGFGFWGSGFRLLAQWAFWGNRLKCIGRLTGFSVPGLGMAPEKEHVIHLLGPSPNWSQVVSSFGLEYVS